MNFQEPPQLAMEDIASAVVLIELAHSKGAFPTDSWEMLETVVGVRSRLKNFLAYLATVEEQNATLENSSLAPVADGIDDEVKFTAMFNQHGDPFSKPERY